MSFYGWGFLWFSLRVSCGVPRFSYVFMVVAQGAGKGFCSAWGCFVWGVNMELFWELFVF